MSNKDDFDKEISSAMAMNLVSPCTERAIEDCLRQNQAFKDAQQQVAQTSEKIGEEQSTDVEANKKVAVSSVPNESDLIAAAAASLAPTSNDDSFANLQKAVAMLGRAKQLDDAKRHDEALKLYRKGVDMLLEELMVRQGTDQSREYLRNKCNDFMNRIDQLKLIIQIENAQKESNEKTAAAATEQVPETTTST